MKKTHKILTCDHNSIVSINACERALDTYYRSGYNIINIVGGNGTTLIILQKDESVS